MSNTITKPARHVGRRGDLPVAGQLLVGVDAFAKMVGISAVGAYRLLKNGEIPAVRLGGRTLIAVTEIEKLIAARSGAFVKRGV
jgi:excisionase family DNA binding protein